MDILEISELLQLARVPHELTNTEVDALRRTQQTYSQKIAILDERKGELIKELSEINQEKSRLLDCLNACFQALSPINHIPDDILREIFFHLYLCFTHHHEDNSFSPLRPPVLRSFAPIPRHEASLSSPSFVPPGPPFFFGDATPKHGG